MTFFEETDAEQIQKQTFCKPTVQSLTQSQNYLSNTRINFPVGCVLSAAVAVCWWDVCLVGGLCQWGCLPLGGCLPWDVYPAASAPGGVCPRGCLPGGVYPGGCVSQHALGQTTPLLDRMTDRCNNITFLQLHLRTVITKI